MNKKNIRRTLRTLITTKLIKGIIRVTTDIRIIINMERNIQQKHIVIRMNKTHT